MLLDDESTDGDEEEKDEEEAEPPRVTIMDVVSRRDGFDLACAPPLSLPARSLLVLVVPLSVFIGGGDPNQMAVNETSLDKKRRQQQAVARAPKRNASLMLLQLSKKYRKNQTRSDVRERAERC